ncbi:hypothetical protein CJO75_18990 (plasmid) [Ralstonia solanacearum]|uniref:hypothetical protein n=1 Tax=Ralstonia pseudosolanacearum TaxID=1310165 RepID=UPI000E58B7D7|nr:hypothetical protein CJO75_18990 [Ralstonia solanacearum]AXW16767.1 hypothetical protein CJO84_19250 [Ralstonia solanacearum]AXW40464.1 hypothetical protein CJO89_19620 [Ralstonia solanacearum]AXW73259.1 hypothetical protein CJO96_18965 [Ralstonia solanacearum]BEU69261.1 hypothetical protein MAFF301069_38160 [Ralstonia pseudosolanacearum]
MSVRRNCLLPLAAAAAFLACGAATAASVSEQALSPLQAHGARDPYTDGGAQAEATLQASVGPRDPYSDGGMSRSSAPRDRDPYTDGAQAA